MLWVKSTSGAPLIQMENKQPEKVIFRIINPFIGTNERKNPIIPVNMQPGGAPFVKYNKQGMKIDAFEKAALAITSNFIFVCHTRTAMLTHCIFGP